MWAARRRTTILLIILGFLFAFIVLPYLWTHREIPTCFDGKMNQNERGIDCDGECVIACKGGVAELHVLWTKVFGVRKGAYDIVAYIENQNANVGIQHLPYVAKLFDDTGAVIAERNGETFVSPNERFAIFEGGMFTGEREAVRGEIEILPNFNWITSKIIKNPFSVQDKNLTGFDNKPKLTAIIKNDSPETTRDVDVVAVIYDLRGQAIGVSSTKVARLLSEESEKLSFTWPTPLNYLAESEECDVPVDAILALDRSGSMTGDGKDPPQPLTDAKNAAEDFVGYMGANNQVGYVTFASDASNPMDQVLTGDASRVKRAIERTAIRTDGLQYTNIGDALGRAIDEFGSFRRNTDANPVIVLLTDGIPNRPLDPNDKENKVYAGEYGKKMATLAKSQGVTLYTIGLGADVDSAYLTELATSPQHFYLAASGGELASIYKQISSAICKKGPSVIEIIPRVNNVTPAF